MADYYTLHTTALPGLVLENDVAPGAVQATVSATLSGRKVIWEQPSNGGGSLDLVGGSDFGWLTRSALAALAALANVVGATYTLTAPDATTRTVRFRNEDGPAIESTPLVARPNQAATDYYNNVKIKLMEV